MTLIQAIKRLSNLGFEMGTQDVAHWGKKFPEKFSFEPHHVLTRPFRDVFIGEAKGGWYITSNIHFEARRYRYRYTYMARIKNIFGHGKTLNEAVNDFTKNFKTLTYNVAA
jgi:hypothetical protein